MKAAVINAKGAPDVLVYSDVPKPQVKPGQILVRNEAAGINFAEVERRRGGFYPVPTPTPYILGGEYAGVIEEVGPGVEGLAVGDEVFGVTDPFSSGCYAQYAAVLAASAIKLPQGVSKAQSTALLIQGMTAYWLLKEGVKLEPGKAVLVMAAAGGVGSLAVQIARLMGAGTVIGCAGSAEKRQAVLNLGADHAIDYSGSDWDQQVRDLTGGRGVDGALVMTGGDSLMTALGCVAPFGIARIYGTANGEPPRLDFGELFAKERMMTNQVLGFFNVGNHVFPMGALPPQEAARNYRESIGQMAEWVRDGKLKVETTAFPLSQAAAAHRAIETRNSTGKVVLAPWVD
ncbi:zinc-binding dehydrogenase [Sphingobium sp. MK2]